MAVAAAFAGLLAELRDPAPLAGTTGLSIVLTFVAGAAALARPRSAAVMTAATVVVALAVITELFGRLGPLYTPALILMAIGIGRTEDTRLSRRPPARRAAPEGMLATEWERRTRLAEQERTVRRAAGGEAVRRAG